MHRIPRGEIDERLRETLDSYIHSDLADELTAEAIIATVLAHHVDRLPISGGGDRQPDRCSCGRTYVLGELRTQHKAEILVDALELTGFEIKRRPTDYLSENTRALQEEIKIHETLHGRTVHVDQPGQLCYIQHASAGATHVYAIPHVHPVPTATPLTPPRARRRH